MLNIEHVFQFHIKIQEILFKNPKITWELHSIGESLLFAWFQLAEATTAGAPHRRPYAPHTWRMRRRPAALGRRRRRICNRGVLHTIYTKMDSHVCRMHAWCGKNCKGEGPRTYDVSIVESIDAKRNRNGRMRFILWRRKCFFLIVYCVHICFVNQ